MDITQRLSLAFEHAGNPSDAKVAAEVSKLLEEPKDREAIPAQTIQKIRQKGTKSRYLPHVAHVLGVSAIWLAEEVGEMLPPDGFVYGINRGVLEAYTRLPRDIQAHFGALIERFEKAALAMAAEPPH